MKVRKKNFWKNRRIWKRSPFLESLKFLQEMGNVRKTSQTHLNPQWLQSLVWFSTSNRPHTNLRWSEIVRNGFFKILTSKFKYEMLNIFSTVWKNGLKSKVVVPHFSMAWFFFYKNILKYAFPVCALICFCKYFNDMWDLLTFPEKHTSSMKKFWFLSKGKGRGTRLPNSSVKNDKKHQDFCTIVKHSSHGFCMLFQDIECLVGIFNLLCSSSNSSLINWEKLEKRCL